MASIKCSECGQVFDDTLSACPNCGCPASECAPLKENNDEMVVQTTKPENVQKEVTKNVQQQIAPAQVNAPKKDIAHYVYECGVIFWHTLTSKFCKFTGRASRREYWTFVILYSVILVPTYIGAIIGLIPFFAVAIRRMHDHGKCGWWNLVPFASFFLYLKRSDPGTNKYGEPCDYSRILS